MKNYLQKCESSSFMLFFHLENFFLFIFLLNIIFTSDSARRVNLRRDIGGRSLSARHQPPPYSYNWVKFWRNRMKFPRFQIVHPKAIADHLANWKNIDLIDENYHSKIPHQDILTPTLSEFLILNNATKIFQNWKVFRLLANMFR